jgi:hypothetical protein
VRTVPCALFAESQSGYNQTIRWKYAFNLSDTQIQVYTAISSGDDNIVYRQTDKRFTILETLHQVAVYIIP